MKIVCEACQAKYSISDDKVRGKAFKIRCKKCSHIIVVRSGEGSGLSPQPEPVAVPTPAVEVATWHIVVDGEQVGPLGESDVRARLARGEITAETYIWREGMGDWLKISAVGDFADGGGRGYDEGGVGHFPGQPATTVYPPGTAEGAFAGSAHEEADAFAAPTMVSSSPAADSFASPVSATGPSGEASSFSSLGGGMSASSEPSARSGGGGFGSSMGNGASAASAGGGGLTGQRHENSVLFSLSNLEALATPSPPTTSSSAPRPGSTPSSEGSGLIDIRSMAAMTLGTSSNESRPSSDLPSFAAPQFSPVAPVLLPMSPVSGPPRWMYAVLALLVVLATTLGFVAYKIWKGRPEPAAPVAPVVVPPVAAPAPAPVAAEPKAAAPGTPPATPPAQADETLPPREGKAPASAEKPRSERSRGSKSSGSERRAGRPSEGGGSGSSKAPVAAAPATPPPSSETPAPKGDKLDDLLSSALGNKRGASPSGPSRARGEDEEKKAPAPAASLGSLQRDDIVRAMQGVAPRVKECFTQYKVPGTANVAIAVARGGRVSGVTVKGKFAGTPTGSCVESAVKTAKLPPVDGQTFDYIFALR